MTDQREFTDTQSGTIAWTPPEDYQRPPEPMPRLYRGVVWSDLAAEIHAETPGSRRQEVIT